MCVVLAAVVGCSSVTINNNLKNACVTRGCELLGRRFPVCARGLDREAPTDASHRAHRPID